MIEIIFNFFSWLFKFPPTIGQVITLISLFYYIWIGLLFALFAFISFINDKNAFADNELTTLKVIQQFVIIFLIMPPILLWYFIHFCIHALINLFRLDRVFKYAAKATANRVN